MESIRGNGAVAPSAGDPKAAQQLATSMAIDDLYAPFKGEKVPKQVNATLGTAQAATSDSTPIVVSVPKKNGKSNTTTTISSVNMSSAVAGSSFLVQPLGRFVSKN